MSNTTTSCHGNYSLNQEGCSYFSETTQADSRYNGVISLRKNGQMSFHLLSVQFCNYAVLCHTQIFHSDWVVFTNNFIHAVVRFMAVMAVDCPIMCGPCTNINISSLVATNIMWLIITCYSSWTVAGLTVTVTDVFIWTILTQFVGRFHPFIGHENP